MDLIFGYKNVFLDSKSDYDLDTINERQYLKRLFAKVESLLGDDFQENNFYILFSHNSSVVPDSFNIVKKNKVLFWFSDESGAFPMHLTKNYNIIFKSYILKEDLNVFSNPLGYINEFEKHADKIHSQRDVDVFFSGTLNDNRIGLFRLLLFRKIKALKVLKILPSKILNKILKNSKIGDLSRDKSVFLFTTKFKTGLVYEKYSDFLKRSKFILCPKGFESNETFRHIESLHSGCIVISEKMPSVSIYEQNPFIVYNNLGELGNILDKIAKKEYDEESLIESHQTFYHNKLEVGAVAQYVSRICKSTNSF